MIVLKRFLKITVILCVFFGVLFLFFNSHLLKKKQRIDGVKNLKVDKVFVINLDKYPKRWQSTKKVLLQVGFKEEQIERFPAIVGLDIKIYDYKNNREFTAKDIREGRIQPTYGDTYKIQCSRDFSFDYEYLNDDFFPLGRYFFSPGELGCTCSHLLVLKEGISREYSNIIVTEDDLFFYKKDSVKNFNLQDELDKIKHLVPKDFELLYLASGKMNKKDTIYRKIESFFSIKKQQIINNFIDFYGHFQGNYILLFNKNGMRDFLQKSKKIKTLATDILYSKYTNQDKKTYFFKDNIFFQQLNSSATGHFGNRINQVFLLNTKFDDENYSKLKESVKNSIIFDDLYSEIIYKDGEIKVLDLENKNIQILNKNNKIEFEKNKKYQIQCNKNVNFEYLHKIDYNTNYYYENIKNFCLNLKTFKEYEKNPKFNKHSSIFVINDRYKVDNNFSLDYFTYITYRLFKRSSFFGATSNLKSNIKFDIKLILSNGDGKFFKCYRKIQLDTEKMDFNLMFFRYKDIEKILQIKNTESLNFNDIIFSLNNKFCFILNYTE